MAAGHPEASAYFYSLATYLKAVLDNDRFRSSASATHPACASPSGRPVARDPVDPKKLVASGYDAAAERYVGWSAGDRARERYTDLVQRALPEGACVLDLGCGAGVPTARRLAECFVVTGVDVSRRQVELARRNVPSATFVHADMADLSFPAGSFDAVVAFYSIVHLPREEHAGLLRLVADWLKPGGLFVASMGSSASEGGVQEDWLGVPMYFSHHDARTNRRLVEEAGLCVIRADEVAQDEDGKRVTFLWMVARKDGGTTTQHSTRSGSRRGNRGMRPDGRDHGLLALWAADCAERVLPYFEEEYPGDERPRNAIEAARAWARGEINMGEARTAAFAAHAAARGAGGAPVHAAHAAGHAAATAHVAGHAAHSAGYAVKAASAANPADSDAAARERDWQYHRLPEHLRPVAFPVQND